MDSSFWMSGIEMKPVAVMVGIVSSENFVKGKV